jgi:hypothetical protein
MASFKNYSLTNLSPAGFRDAYSVEGEAAGNAGCPFEDNPYDLGSLESVGWVEGWCKRKI